MPSPYHLSPKVSYSLSPLSSRPLSAYLCPHGLGGDGDTAILQGTFSLSPLPFSRPKGIRWALQTSGASYRVTRILL